MRPAPNEKEMEDLKIALNHNSSRRVLSKILTQCRPLAPSYAPGDALAQAYNEGLRAIGLWLLAEIEKAAPGQGIQLLQEK